MEDLGLTDVGALGSWSVSSYKQGSGIKELREDSHDLFWQSDGAQPHHLDIHFAKKVSISRLSFFTDFSQDESYTPSKIVILSGSGFHNLVEVVSLDLNKPSGWTNLVFNEMEELQNGLETFLIRILIKANHQHGKDTHLRSVKIYSPMTSFSMKSTILGSFTSKRLLSESTIR
ncbi:hypothetical protein WICMUC_004533 [Wickerhamomyces mucosus]|uniref:Anaphase-promoting complex subunit 10 n=1 Tax=Wickerhamomyces mucosus TaxID=1378264 RepID=A0A9P8PHW7_9ASCO|nr:hypothetical protein WICMUC_004533 [Wickerhamomyces mucosus]